jgi:hypothetical protein
MKSRAPRLSFKKPVPSIEDKIRDTMARASQSSPQHLRERLTATRIKVPKDYGYMKWLIPMTDRATSPFHMTTPAIEWLRSAGTRSDLHIAILPVPPRPVNGEGGN